MLIAAILVLLASIYLIFIFFMHVVGVWLSVVTFWGRVAWRNPEKISYEFKFDRLVVIAGIIGAAGILWSVIKLAVLL